MAPSKKSALKESAAKRSAAGKSPAKKSAARKSAAKKSAAKSAADKYTDPALREHIKHDVLAGDKGGRPGQWSARKAQLVAHEYEAEGGTYKGPRDETQQSLTHWGEEHWTTADGKPAGREDGMHRYLPEDAWKDLTPAQKKATNKKKLAADHQGKQYAPNTKTAVKARKAAEK